MLLMLLMHVLTNIHQPIHIRFQKRALRLTQIQRHAIPHLLRSLHLLQPLPHILPIPLLLPLILPPLPPFLLAVRHQSLLLGVQNPLVSLRVGEAAVRLLELEVRLVVVSAGLGEVVVALEVVLVEGVVGEFDERVDERVVEVRQGFDVPGVGERVVGRGEGEGEADGEGVGPLG